MNTISKEAEELLDEIIDHESESEHWKQRFDEADKKTDMILRGCFKELKDNDLIKSNWADNIPYSITILKDGYLYQKHKEELFKSEKEASMGTFEKNLYRLLEKAKSLYAPNRLNFSDDNKKDMIAVNSWMDDVQIFYDKYLKKHALSNRFETLLLQRKFDELVAALTSVSNDKDFIDSMNGIEKVEVPKYQAKTIPEYDVFISHANKDKKDLIEELYQSLNRLGINIFYDKESLDWGDNWKESIINGTQKAEFAIIVISENFFDREWTEKELSEFLNRQNRNGQKLILPIVHNITNEQLREKYPNVADIQAIDSSKYSTDQIALLFARQLIKRLKSL